MNAKTGTRMRILAALLLLGSTALSGTAGPGSAKRATGCSLTGGSPGPDGCTGGEDGCYDCLHSDRYGIYECYESPDGATLYCQPFQN